MGAGRKPFNTDPKWLSARVSGLTPLHANMILGQLIDERKQWLKVFNSDDERVILQALIFLVSMRDGKPAQQINVTSQSVTVNVDDIAKARAIVRELMATPMPGGEHTSPDVRERMDGERAALMLSGDDGGKKGG